VFAESCDGAKSFHDQGPLQAAADVFHFRRLRRVTSGPTDRLVKDLDQRAEIVAKMFGRRATPVVHVHDLYAKADSLAVDDDVLGMQVAVVLAGAMNFFDAADQRVEHVQRFERMQSPAALSFE